MHLAQLTWPVIDALDRDTPVVIPVAALEQHGHHLPVFTDSLLLGEIVRRAHERLNQRLLLVPLMWLGNSHHHLDFPGTLSAEPRVYLDLLNGLIDNFIVHGFRRIVVVNGHGGNDVPGRQSVFELRQRYRKRRDLLLLFATYWQLAEPAARIPDLVQSTMGHACEWETSMVLAIAPDTVREHLSINATDATESFAPAARAWTMPDRSPAGHIGNPGAASAAKGEQLLELFSAGLVDFFERVLHWDGASWNE